MDMRFQTVLKSVAKMKSILVEKWSSVKKGTQVRKERIH